MAATRRPVLGPKSDKIWRDAIQRAVRRHVDGKNGPQALERLADRLVSEGLAGDIAAIREIGDRLDGKPAQAIVGDSSASPISLVITWEGSEKSPE